MGQQQISMLHCRNERAHDRI